MMFEKNILKFLAFVCLSSCATESQNGYNEKYGKQSSASEKYAWSSLRNNSKEYYTNSSTLNSVAALEKKMFETIRETCLINYDHNTCSTTMAKCNDHIQINRTEGINFLQKSAQWGIREAGEYLRKLNQSPFNPKLLKPLASNILIFEDGKIKIEFNFLYTYLSFYLENHSFGQMEIDWDNTYFIDSYQNAYNVVHRGVRYQNSHEYPKRTILGPGKSVSDLIIPNDNISYSSSGWDETPLFKNVPEHLNKIVRFFLTLKTKKGVIKYTFEFLLAE